MRPLLVSCDTKGGAEASIHAARYFLSYDKTECPVLLKTDFRNASNALHRDVLLVLVQQANQVFLLCSGKATGFPPSSVTANISWIRLEKFSRAIHLDQCCSVLP